MIEFLISFFTLNAFAADTTVEMLNKLDKELAQVVCHLATQK